jgi:uncharacterized protein (DUF305 family)
MGNKYFVTAAIVAGCFLFSACSRVQSTAAMHTGATDMNYAGNKAVRADETIVEEADSLTPRVIGDMENSNPTKATSPVATPPEMMSGNAASAMQLLTESMENMLSTMTAMEMTGNIDHDFADMLIAHHRGAIDLTKIVLQSGDNTEIRSFALKTRDKHQREIKTLQVFSNKATTTATEDPGIAGKQLISALDDTMEKMREVKMTRDADQNFALMMLQQYTDAIEMADVELQYGKDPELKALVKQIRQEQSNDMRELKNWLRTYGN